VPPTRDGGHGGAAGEQGEAADGPDARSASFLHNLLQSARSRSG
jgi:hypothetical protein